MSSASKFHCQLKSYVVFTFSPAYNTDILWLGRPEKCIWMFACIIMHKGPLKSSRYFYHTKVSYVLNWMRFILFPLDVSRSWMLIYLIVLRIFIIQQHWPHILVCYTFFSKYPKYINKKCVVTWHGPPDILRGVSRRCADPKSAPAADSPRSGWWTVSRNYTVWFKTSDVKKPKFNQYWPVVLTLLNGSDSRFQNLAMFWMWRQHDMALWSHDRGAWLNHLSLTAASSVNCWASLLTTWLDCGNRVIRKF